jgi:hypothetical protein
VFFVFIINLLYIKTIGVMAGNLIAANPAIQLAVKSEIDNGLIGSHGNHHIRLINGGSPR